MVLQNSTASAIFPLARPKMFARAISSENMARLPMSKLRRLNNGSQAEEIQGQSNECDDSSGLCDDSVCVNYSAIELPRIPAPLS